MESRQIADRGAIHRFNTVKWESNFPLFFRPGAIVPMLREDVQYVGEKPLTELNIEVFPGHEAHFIRLLR